MKMKKIFILVLVTATLLSLSVIPISAARSDIEISENYATLTYAGEEYVLVDSDNEYAADTEYHSGNVSLTDTQSDEIAYIEAYTSDNFVDLYIEFNKGGNASYLYVRRDSLDKFRSFEENGGDEYTVSLFYGNVTTSADKLFGKAMTIKGYELSYYYCADMVYESALDGEVRDLSTCRYLFNDGNGNILYFDYELSLSEKDLDPAMNKTLTVWQITDAELLSSIRDNAFEGTYDDMNSGDIEGAPIVFAVIIFAFFLGLVPLAGAIVCFILSFNASVPYKKHLRIAAAILAAAALVAALTVILIIAWV